MLLAYVDEAYAKLEMREVTCMGADEMNRRKGHNYLAVFYDLVRKRVLFACEGKEAKAWHSFAQALCEHINNGDPEAHRAGLHRREPRPYQRSERKLRERGDRIRQIPCGRCGLRRRG